MTKTNLNFSLVKETISEIPFDKYNKNFTFIVNGKQFKTNRVVADILSPIVRNYHNVDESVNEFSIDTSKNSGFAINSESNQEDYFEDFLKLATFKNYDIEYSRQQKYSEYFFMLGNIDEFFRIQSHIYGQITTENIIDHLKQISIIITKYSFKFQKSSKEFDEIISFAAQNFFQIDQKEIEKMSPEVIELIISDEKLKVKSEDSLLEFLLDIYEKDETCAYLFGKVAFANVTENVLESFVQRFDVNHIDASIWKRICEKLLPNSSEKMINHEYENTETAIPFELDSNQKFNGILKYLNDKSGGNIMENGTVKITANSQHSGYPLRNLVDFQSTENGCYYRSGNDCRVTIQFDFDDKLVQVTDYSIKTGTYDKNCGHLKNWTIEVSNDEKEWTEIDRRENDSTLNGQQYSSSFSVKQKTNKFYRFVRLHQTGDTWYNDNLFEITLIEFFGKLLLQS